MYVGTSDVSALLTEVGTAGARARQKFAEDLASGLPTRACAELSVGSSDSCRDFRRPQSPRSTSAVPTHVRTSDARGTDKVSTCM